MASDIKSAAKLATPEAARVPNFDYFLVLDFEVIVDG